MQLYVIDKTTKNKIYIEDKAYSKQHLATVMGSNYFKVENQYFTVNEVIAEDKYSNFNKYILIIVPLLVVIMSRSIIGGIMAVLAVSIIAKDSVEAIELFNNSCVAL